MLGKRVREVVCASGFPSLSTALPTVDVRVGNQVVRALVDTGCSRTIAARKLVGEVRPSRDVVVSVDGSILRCSVGHMRLVVQDRCMNARVLVLDSLLSQFDLVLGMDVIQEIGGLYVKDGKVVLGDPALSLVSLEGATHASDVSLATCIELEDMDFKARFDGQKWVVSWKWRDKEPKLTNAVPCYSVGTDVRQEWEVEVESWITEGILTPVPDGAEVSGVIPLMAVSQPNKGKVRPVMDFREVNQFVSSHSGDCDVCDETLREWREVGDNITLLDLRKAYLQLHVEEDLWKHQAVEFKGSRFYLTRLGFGLSSAPKIMTSILRKVLSLEETIRRGTDSYLDDILVNNDIVDTDKVADHLLRFGLRAKPAESIEKSKVLGLKMKRMQDGHLSWERGNSVPSVADQVTRRELFSICGLLVGHYPVCGWLRVACSFIKRASEGTRWEDGIGGRARGLLQELLQRVQENDPVGGRWAVTSSKCRLWCDASSLAIGCAIEAGGDVIEDSSWLRKADDGNHINIAELEAVLKGLNLVAKWRFDEVEILTDSVTVHAWLTATLNGTHKVKVKGMSEMLVKRRLFLVKEYCEAYKMTLSVRWVDTSMNKADVLTRVPRRWLQVASACCSLVQQIHSRHHLGVDRTLYLVRKEDSSVSKREVADCISKCHQCKSVDPAPVSWTKGTLSVEDNWARLAIDITHFNGKCYLTLVDCGPSRFVIWRRMGCEDAERICMELQQIFRERGPPKEVLMDNGRAFRSQRLKALLDRWSVLPVYRCAFRPECNGVVERCHRTIKRMAARSNADPLDMVFWFNSTPKEGSRESSVPALQLHSYSWRTLPVRAAKKEVGDFNSDFVIGSRVFVKPMSARCHSRWPVGRVTAINSRTNMDVNGVPRHISDLRIVPVVPEASSPVEESSEPSASEGEENLGEMPSRPQRSRRPPDRYVNNIYDT